MKISRDEEENEKNDERNVDGGNREKENGKTTELRKIPT